MALGTPPSWQAWAVFRYFRKHRLLFLYKNTEQTANILPRQHPSYHQSRWQRSTTSASVRVSVNSCGKGLPIDSKGWGVRGWKKAGGTEVLADWCSMTPTFAIPQQVLRGWFSGYLHMYMGDYLSDLFIDFHPCMTSSKSLVILHSLE